MSLHPRKTDIKDYHVFPQKTSQSETLCNGASRRDLSLLDQQADNSPALVYQENSTLQLSSSQIDVAQTTLPQTSTSFEGSADAASELHETDSNQIPVLPSHEPPDSGQHSQALNGSPHSNPSVSNVEETPPQRTEISVTQRIAELLPWMAANRRWIELFYKHALKDTFLDEALDILGSPCKQWKIILSNISHLSGLKDEMQNFAMCPGHMAFVPDPIQDEIPAHCSQCRKVAPQTRNGDNVCTYFPILPRLQSMIRKEKTCQEIFAYRKTRLSDANVCRDFFDGAVYQKICSRFGGETAVENDVFIIASTDGFSPFKNRSYDVWSIAAINLNLPPDQRYMPQNVFPLAFVPGPNQPKYIQSFLLPLVRELKKAINGIMMTFPDGSQRLFRVHLVGFTGDQPAVSKVSGLIGHKGKSPCRDFTIHGYYKNHYYFPSKVYETSSRAKILFNPRQLPIRNESTTRDSIRLIEGMSGTERRELQTKVGIRESSVLFEIPAIVPYSSFPHDVIHTFYNAQNELLRIMLEPYNDDFSINRQLLTMLDEELVSWKWGISGQLGPAPKPLSKYRDWKVAEHKLFSIAYSLVLFDGHLSRRYLDGLQMFSELFDICTRAEVTPVDVACVRDLAARFYEHFEKSYYRYRLDRVDFCKSVFHVLLHLADCMERFGPLIGVSQYWVEGYIDWMGQRNNSRIKPAQAMIKNALFGESLKFYYDKMAYERSSGIEEVIENQGFLPVGAPREIWLQKLPRDGRRVREMIAGYFCRKYDLSTAKAKFLSSSISLVKLYPRLRYIACSEIQTASVYQSQGENSTSRKRSSYYIAAEMCDDGSADCQVWFGRLLKIISFNIGDFETGGHLIPGRRYDLVVADWAKKLRKGQQGVYVQGSLKDVFSRATAEDVSVVKRLVRVIEHRVPLNSTSNAPNSRARWEKKDLHRRRCDTSGSSALSNGIN